MVGGFRMLTENVRWPSPDPGQDRPCTLAVFGVGVPEARAKRGLFCPDAPEIGDRAAEQHGGERDPILHGEPGADQGQNRTAVGWVAQQAVRTGADQLVLVLNDDCRSEEAAERRNRPQSEPHAAPHQPETRPEDHRWRGADRGASERRRGPEGKGDAAHDGEADCEQAAAIARLALGPSTVAAEHPDLHDEPCGEAQAEGRSEDLMHGPTLAKV